MPYDYRPFPYVAPPGLTAPEPRHKVVIVGAGPIGLALAIDLAQSGVASVVLDDNNVVSVGSRAICWSKRSLEILDRLGVGQRCVEKGVIWKVGRTLHREDEVWTFDLQPDPGHKMPAFVNLQQYYVEEYLVARATEFPELIDLRWKNKVAGLTSGDHVVLTTPVYHAFARVIKAAGRGVTECPLAVVDGRYQMDFARWDDAVVGDR